MPGVKNKSGGKRLGAGRPAFKPTEKQRKLVKKLSALGVRHSDIPLFMEDAKGNPISEPTMREYFSFELAIGAVEANTKVADTLFNKATKQEDTAAMRFWLRCRAGWKDTQRVELTGSNGGPMQSISITTNDPIEAAKDYQQIMNS